MERLERKGKWFVELPAAACAGADAASLALRVTKSEPEPPPNAMLLRGTVLQVADDGWATVSCGGLIAGIHDRAAEWAEGEAVWVSLSHSK